MTAQTLTTEQMQAKWDDAFERLRVAEAACQEFINATDGLYRLETLFRSRHGLLTTDHRPDYLDRVNALREANPAYFVPELIDDERDRLVDEVVKIEGELMAAPAPDLPALRWKLDKTANTCWEESYLAQMYADMDRLMGSAPDATTPSKAAA